MTERDLRPTSEPRASASGTEGERSHPEAADRLRCRSLTVAARTARPARPVRGSRAL